MEGSRKRVRPWKSGIAKLRSGPGEKVVKARQATGFDMISVCGTKELR